MNLLCDFGMSSPRARVISAVLDALGPGVEHGAAAGEEHSRLHDHAHRGDVAFDSRPAFELDGPECADVAVHAAGDHRLLDLDVGAHHAVLTDLQPLAVQ